MSAVGVGAKTLAEDTIKEMVCMPSDSRATAQARAKASYISDRRDTTQSNATFSPKEKARARDSKESVTTVARKGILHGSARKARNEESRKGQEPDTKLQVKDGVGRRHVASRRRRNPRRLLV